MKHVVWSDAVALGIALAIVLLPVRGLAQSGAEVPDHANVEFALEAGFPGVLLSRRSDVFAETYTLGLTGTIYDTRGNGWLVDVQATHARGICLAFCGDNQPSSRIGRIQLGYARRIAWRRHRTRWFSLRPRLAAQLALARGSVDGTLFGAEAGLDLATHGERAFAAVGGSYQLMTSRQGDVLHGVQLTLRVGVHLRR